MIKLNVTYFYAAYEKMLYQTTVFKVSYNRVKCFPMKFIFIYTIRRKLRVNYI